MELGLEGRVALVAGATAGLGLAIGRALAKEGAAVALAGRRGEVAAKEAAALSRGMGVKMDLLDAASISDAVAQVESELGAIDIVILNSGGPPPASAISLDVEALRAAGELLLYGPIELVNATLPAMRARRWGRIIAVGSSGIQQPIPVLTSSSMFRAAIASYLKLLAEAVAPDGVTVNMVLPGRILTDRTVQIDTAKAESTGSTVDEARRSSEQLIPIGRYGTPDEFAALAAFLSSDAASYITGEQIRIDGGLIRGL